MKILHSLLRDFCLRSRILLGLGVAGLVGWQPVAAADAARRAPVRPVLRHTLPARESAPTLPAGLTLVDWRQIRAEYERHRHGMFADGKGEYQSRSHYHGWLARFDGKGFVVVPDTKSWSWGLQLVSWGREGNESGVSGRGAIRRDGNWLEYRRTGITEWFENGKEGLEHGFTIGERPKGDDGELSIALRQRGKLVAELDAGGHGVTYRTAQGDVALRYRKLEVTDAQGRRLLTRMVTEGDLLRILVDDQGAVYPVVVDPIVQQAYLKASNTEAADRFGTSVAISGDTVVVGAHQEDSNATGVNGTQSNNSASGSGAAYVFVRSGGTWSQQAYLKASNTGANDWFGCSVAISGDTVVVGAYGESSNATGINGNQSDNSASESGAAYVFVRNAQTWTQQAYLKASNTGANDRFGVSVAISGDTVGVGAWGEDSNATGVNGNQNDNSASASGAAYLFVRSSGTWIQQAYLKASNPGAVDQFGVSVAISGDTVVVGAVFEASNATGVNGNQIDNSASESGAAYVFVRSSQTWTQQAYLKASNTGANDCFGVSVAISGDTVVVGAYQEDSNATGVNGTQSDDSASISGAAYVFVRSSGTWTQQAYLKASNTGPVDRFGFSVAISGDTVVVGAIGEDSNATGVNGTQSDNSASNSGAAYVFVRSSGTWSQQVYLKTSNTGASDQFGWSVAISGNTVVGGANGEGSNTTGVNGTQSDDSASISGAAYVFVDGPSVTGISPSSGPLAGGQTVTITGTNLTGATAVRIGGATALSFTVVSSTSITATTPAGSAGTASVLVTTPAGTSGANALYTYLAGSITISPQSDSAPAAGQTGKSVTVTANSPSWGWTAASNSSWLTITAGASGSGSGTVTYNVAANTSTSSRTGTLMIGGQTLTLTQSGATTSPTLTLARSVETAPMGGAAGRTVAVTAPTGLAWTATSAVNWIAITGGAAGSGNGIVTYTVRANSGVGSRSGVITVGGATLTVTQAGPTPIATGSIAGAGSANTFTFTFTHPEGFGRLGVVNVLINRALDGGRACYLAYSQPFQTLFLVDDNGPDAGLSALTLGGTGSVSNSQCTVNAAGSSAATAGDTLTLRLNIDFKPGFAGNHLIYLAAREDGSGGANSGWTTQGAWTVPGRPITYPRAIGMTPAAVSWSGSSVFSFTFEDQTSANNLQTAWVLMNTALDAAGACYVAYFVPGNLVLLFPDNGDGAQATAMELTGTNTVENSQCRISASGSSVTKSGGRLTLNLNMTPKSGLMGPQGVWMATQPLSGAASGWSALGNRIVQ